jgi:hypothetical protein
MGGNSESKSRGVTNMKLKFRFDECVSKVFDFPDDIPEFALKDLADDWAVNNVKGNYEIVNSELFPSQT